MKQTHKDKSLVKKVVLSVLAVGVATSFVLSAEAAVLNVNGETVEKYGAEFSEIYAQNSASVTLNGGRVIGYQVERRDDEDSAVAYADIAADISDKSTLVANRVDFTGGIEASGGSKIVITGGSITAGNFYDSNYKALYTTEISADGSDSSVILDKVTINSNLGAFDDGVVTVNNSSVTADTAIYAEGGTINLSSTDGSAVYTVKGDGIEAEDGGEINIDGGKVNTTYMVANAGTTITVNNADVEATEIIVADGEKASITFNGAEKNSYTVSKGFVATNDGKIYINGGTLADNNLKSKMYGIVTDESKTLNTSAKGIVLDKNGVISTMSDQIYANAASATQKQSGAITNEGIDFRGGSLILNDEKFTQSYSDSAQSELKKQGVTKLTMAGELVKEESGEVQEKITVEEASEKYGSDVALDKVTATAEKNLLVGTTASLAGNDVNGVIVGEQVANGFAVASLEVKKDADTSVGVVITNDKNVTLGGSAGGSIITVKDSEDQEVAGEAVKVVVGTTSAVTGATSQAGTLTIGNSLATADTRYNLEGEVVVNKDSKLVVNGVTNVSDAVTLNQATVAVKDGALLSTDNVNVEDNSAVTGAVSATTVDVTNGKILSIGDKDNAGKLMADEINLNGGTLFLDPAWKDGKTIGDASGAEVNNSVLDGAYVVGQNSKLALGAGLDDLDKVFASTNQTWGKDVTAVAYIAKQISLNGGEGKEGSLTVDNAMTDTNIGDYQPTQQSVNMGANSLLIVNGTEAARDEGDTTGHSKFAIDNVKAATVADSSKLYIDNAQKNKVYTILTNTDPNVTSYDSVWTDENLISNNSLLKLEGEQTDVTYNTDASINASVTYHEYQVTTSLQSVKDAYGDAVITPDAYDAALKDDESAAGKFAWNAADNNVNAGKSAQVSALNSAASMGELAGVEHGTYAASNLMTDAVSDHLSLANDRTHDSDIWAKYIHTKEDIDGLDIAGAGASYDAQFNGVVVGADLYHGGKATVGVALSYVDGNINGSTLAASTKNDATYYGASIYGGIQNADSAIVGDISYLHGKNDITQYNSGATLTADAKSDAFSIGVRAEKSFAAGAGKFVPYAGVRYMHLGTGNYINSIGMAYDGDDLNLWLLPVGVKYSANVAAGGWTIRPIAEVGYVWNLGDTDAAQTVSMSGAGNSFSYDVTDSGSYIARLALEAEKADVTYGLAYEYQKGDSVKANRFTANVNWSF